MRPINRCLNKQLLDICQQVLQLEKLTLQLKSYLPAPLVDHCYVGSFSKGCLIINTSNAAWATELHYHVPALRDNLRKAGLYQLASIKIMLGEFNQPQTPSRLHSSNDLSAIAQDTLRLASEKCDHLPLKKALRRLARMDSEQNLQEESKALDQVL